MYRLTELKALSTGRPHSVVRLPDGHTTVRPHALTRCVVVLETFY